MSNAATVLLSFMFLDAIGGFSGRPLINMHFPAVTADALQTA